MTREEAITLLEKLRTFHNGTYAKSIDMAIEALQAEPLVYCKECEYSKDTGDYQDSYFCTSRTHAQDFLVHSYDYCSYGAKMDTREEE